MQSNAKQGKARQSNAKQCKGKSKGGILGELSKGGILGEPGLRMPDIFGKDLRRDG